MEDVDNDFEKPGFSLALHLLNFHLTVATTAFLSCFQAPTSAVGISLSAILPLANDSFVRC